jgi:endogenous inhibitor of DNA gyrase (YacG/DUF329 family)
MTAEAARNPVGDGRSVEAQGVCAICGRPRDPRYDPFCSRRCADVDLHRWLKGGYVIPGGEPSRSERDDDA